MRSAYLSALFSGFALVACLGGDDPEPGFSITGTMEVLSIDRQAGTITTRATATKCQSDGSSVSQTETNVDHFAVTAGKLVLWDEEDCTAITLAGTSADIIGTWKGTGIQMQSAIPAEYRPAACPAEITPDTAGLGMFSDLAATYAISEKKLEFTATGTLCLADRMAAEMAGNGLTVVSKSCSDLVLENDYGERVSVRTSLGPNRMAFSISGGGRSCGLTTEFPLPGHPIDCARQMAAVQSYQDCVRGGAAAKVSASLQKALPKLF